MALYAFDGTWNSEKDAGRYDLNTNVVRFKDLYAGTKFFYKGVGTSTAWWARSPEAPSGSADTSASETRSGIGAPVRGG